MFYSKICVCKRLSLYSLRSVHDKHRPLACGKRTRYLIVKVNMTRGIYQIKHIVFTVIGMIIQTDSTSLYSNSAFALNIHIIKQLIFHIAQSYSFGLFQYSVGKRGFSVVYMGYYTEISDIFLIHLLYFLSEISILFHYSLL